EQQRREVEPRKRGNHAPRRHHHPAGSRDDELAQHVAERHAQPLEEEPREQQVDEETHHHVHQEDCDLLEHQSRSSCLPSSAPRSRAASSARRKRSASFCSSKALSAASVVPPLDVTRSRSVAGESGLCAASLAAPRTVSIASFFDVAGSRPNASPALASCSMNQNT